MTFVLAEQFRQEAYNYLRNKIKSIGKEINDEKLEMADYLQPDDILNNNEQKLILKVRCQKYIFNNFQNYSKCICLEYADAKHIYECIMLTNSERKHEFNLKFK